MKNLRLIAPMLLTLAVFAACNNGPSAQELQRIQQQRDDSIRNDAIEKQKAQAAREAENQKREEDKQTLRQILAVLDAKLQGEETRMGSVKSFQLLRTSSEKEEQVRAQALRINEVKLQIEDLQEQLRKLQNGERYLIPSVN